MSHTQTPPPHPDPTLPLSRDAWWQLTHTLETLLPGPLNDTPQALLARTHAALAKISDMAPVNSDEADLAAQCVACRAQAEETMRDLRRLDGSDDDKRRAQLNRMYVALIRTALSLRRQLQRMQADRREKEADTATTEAESWTRYIAAREMQQALAQPAGLTAEPPLPPALEYQTPQPDPVPPDISPPDIAEAAAAAPPLTSPAVPPPQPEPSPPSPRLPEPLPRPSPPFNPHPSRHAPAEEIQPRDLDQEVEYYAAVYPRRARQIRQYGGLPPDCTFGPPDEELLAALLASRSPNLLAIDADPGIL